jgi:hypothetical protein
MFHPERRYQECSVWERAWRRRYWLAIPYEAAQIFLANQRAPGTIPAHYADGTEAPFERTSWRMAWSIASGLACQKAKWYYTSEEVLGPNWRNEKDDESVD